MARSSAICDVIVSGIADTYVSLKVTKLYPKLCQSLHARARAPDCAAVPLAAVNPAWCPLQYDCHATVSPCNTHMTHLQQAGGLLKQIIWCGELQRLSFWHGLNKSDQVSVHCGPVLSALTRVLFVRIGPVGTRGCRVVLNYALLAFLLQSVVIAAAARTPASRRLASTVGGFNDPEVKLPAATQTARLFLKFEEFRLYARLFCAGSRIGLMHDSTFLTDKQGAHLLAESCGDAVQCAMSLQVVATDGIRVMQKVAAQLKACEQQSAAGRGRCKELREYMARCQRVRLLTFLFDIIWRDKQPCSRRSAFCET